MRNKIFSNAYDGRTRSLKRSCPTAHQSHLEITRTSSTRLNAPSKCSPAVNMDIRKQWRS